MHWIAFLTSTLIVTKIIETFLFSLGFMLFCHCALKSEFENNEDKLTKIMLKSFFKTGFKRLISFKKANFTYVMNGVVWKPWFSYYITKGEKNG